MKREGLITLCLMGALFLGCSKSNVKPGPTPEQTPTSPKTAPDNYAKTYTDGTSLFALWKPVSGYTSIYNQYGLLLGVDKLPAAALSQMQFLDATHFKETHYAGDIYSGGYDLDVKDSTTFIRFISDEGFVPYSIDTLSSGILAISQITKYPSGNPYNFNGKNYTVYETVLHFNFNQ
jgi:hypothetical protein